MPLLTRLYLRAGLLYLLAALLINAAFALRELLPSLGALQFLFPVYLHLFMVGWVTQLIFGVSYWMFPTFSREHPRGNERLAAATFVLLNVGLLLRAFAEPAIKPIAKCGFKLAAGPLGGAAMACRHPLFAGNTWVRVKGR